MSNFTALLISLCNIQRKALVLSGYTTTPSWSAHLSNVPCRKDSVTNASISDGQLRENTDDDVFYFNPDVDVKRGDRIVFSSENYDVIKVNQVFDSTAIHHLEVVARITDND